MEPETLPDEIAAAEAAERDDPAPIARRWLLTTAAATLCTTSAHRAIEGFPFGSVVPFALTAEGRPVMLLAEIAAHTANLKRDPRASLFVRQPDVQGDPQAGWRLTVIGVMEPLDEVPEEIEARYRERVPAAEGYRETHGFSYWWMPKPIKGRYIAGFGKICWLDGAALLRDPDLGESGPGAVAHMNEDHASTMVEMCTGLHGFTPESARMVGIDRTGFLVRTAGPERLVHFSFGREIAADDLRLAVIEVLRRARAGGHRAG